jgi:hypothetical protein
LETEKFALIDGLHVVRISVTNMYEHKQSSDACMREHVGSSIHPVIPGGTVTLAVHTTVQMLRQYSVVYLSDYCTTKKEEEHLSATPIDIYQTSHCKLIGL